MALVAGAGRHPHDPARLAEIVLVARSDPVSSPLHDGSTVYFEELTRRLLDLIGAPLVGVYLSGSAAFDAMIPGRSDLDVIGVIGPCPESRVRAVAVACSHRSLPCPARKLELVLYPSAAVGSTPPTLDWALNLNSGAGEERVSFDPRSEPRHWFVLDVAIARDHARALVGPPAAEAFAPLERSRVVDAVRVSIAWHREHESSSPSAVLNACRGWAWATTGEWLSKPDAARWVADRSEHQGLVRLALAIHRGETRATLRPASVDAFATEVDRQLG